MLTPQRPAEIRAMDQIGPDTDWKVGDSLVIMLNESQYVLTLEHTNYRGAGLNFKAHNGTRGANDAITEYRERVAAREKAAAMNAPASVDHIWNMVVQTAGKSHNGG